MNILVSPNAFKHALTAEEAALAIREGFLQSNLSGNFECFPIGDGGDGTGDLIIRKCNGIVVQAKAKDALGREITASFGLIDNGKTAVVEMASASGLRHLQSNELNPLKATTSGTGDLIKAAMKNGAQKIIITMGGSATVDGGMGILQSLGTRFLDKDDNEISSPESLDKLFSIDVSGLDKRISTGEIVVLCDVDNMLLGEKGSAAVFGPQKGASPSDVNLLDKALATLAKVIMQKNGINISDIKYGGTAGGAAAGLYGLLNAKLVNGIDYFLELTNFDAALNNCDVVITGEGSIDEQTLNGKGPFGVARAAKERGVPVIGVAGKISMEPNMELQKYFDVLLSISNQPAELKEAIANTKTNLVRTGRAIGNLLALNKDQFK